MWIRLCPPSLSLHRSTLGSPGSPRPSPKLHPRGQIPFPVSKFQGVLSTSHFFLFFSDRFTFNIPLLLSLFFVFFFPSVSSVILSRSDHQSYVCWQHSLPRTPQGFASAFLEVPFWLLHKRLRWAGRPHYYEQQQHREGHMEFNAAHSHVTNRIRIPLQVTWRVTGAALELKEKFSKIPNLLFQLFLSNKYIFTRQFESFLDCITEVKRHCLHTAHLSAPPGVAGFCAFPSFSLWHAHSWGDWRLQRELYLPSE